MKKSIIQSYPNVNLIFKQSSHQCPVTNTETVCNFIILKANPEEGTSNSAVSEAAEVCHRHLNVVSSDQSFLVVRMETPGMR